MNLAFIAILLVASGAQAGYWRDFCRRHLVAPDPYQYEQTREETIRRRIQFLENRKTWKKATESELEELGILEMELFRRRGAL